MSSLHTKYRPATFDDVVGQAALVKSIRKVIADKRAHSFLLTGPAGTGKTTLARLMVREFAGEGFMPTNIEEVDAASKSGADDMREIIARTHHLAMGKSPIKGIIIDEAHSLSAKAWTVLLKPMEEPPPHVYWFLATTDPAKIPKINVTRCVRYDLKPIDDDTVFKLLCKVADAEGLKTGDDVLNAIVDEAGGSARQALVFLEACAYAESAGEARQIMRTAAQSKEIGDLCRWLLAGQKVTWEEGLKYLKALEGQEAESIRIAALQYFAAVARKTKGNKITSVLALMDCFSRPYVASDKQAPLMLSLADALGLTQ